MSMEDVIRIAAIASAVSAVAWWTGRKEREKNKKAREDFLKKTPDEREKDFKLFQDVFGGSGKNEGAEQKDKNTPS